MGLKEGAWDADAKVIAGVDDLKNQHPLNCTEDGTLEVDITAQSAPLDVIVDNIVPVSQSGPWTVNLAAEPTIDIGKVDQGTPGTQPWLFSEQSATLASVSAIMVTSTSTVLAVSNSNRKKLIIQTKDAPLYIILGSIASPSLYSYYVLPFNVLEIEGYTGILSAITDSLTALVMVTESV